MKYLRIRDWHKHFENNRTRDMARMQWIPVPNKHDGEGFRNIMAHPEGIIIYGCWHLILQIASKAHPRGTLLRDDGTPITAHTIAVKTGWLKEADIQKAIDFCSSAEVGWIEVLTKDDSEIPHPPAEIPHPPAWNGMEQNNRNGTEGREEKEQKRGKSDSDIFSSLSCSVSADEKCALKIFENKTGFESIKYAIFQSHKSKEEPAKDIQKALTGLSDDNLKIIAAKVYTATIKVKPKNWGGYATTIMRKLLGLE